MTLAQFFGVLNSAPPIMVRRGRQSAPRTPRTPAQALLQGRAQAVRHGRADGALAGKRKSRTLLSGVIAFRTAGRKK